jgi:hypothetical protein
VPTANIEFQDSSNYTVLNKLVQTTIEEAFGFRWIKQAKESAIKLGAHYPWNEAIGWMKTNFRCSQNSIMKKRSRKVGELDSQRFKTPMKRWPCHGTLELACDTMSDPPLCLVRLKHHVDHPPHGAYETPRAVLDYIKKFWMPSSHEQWTAIHVASKQGYLEASVEGLTQKIVHFWWSQSMVERVRKDSDPWVSLQMYLKEQPDVNYCNLYRDLHYTKRCVGACIQLHIGWPQSSNVVCE